MFWTETGHKKDGMGEPEVCPRRHLGERLAGTFGPTQQGLSVARQGPAPSPWDRCQVDSLTWKLMWYSPTEPVTEMVSTRWKGTRCAYCIKDFPFTVTCQQECIFQERGLRPGREAHLSLQDPCF